MVLFFGFLAVLVALGSDVFIKDEKLRGLQIPLLSLLAYGLYLHANSTSAFLENPSIYWLIGTGMILASIVAFWIQKKVRC